MKNLKGKNIAILVSNGFEEIEFTKPKSALEGAGATVEVIAPEAGKVKAWNHTDWGASYDVDHELDYADAGQYDGLMLPGGVMNPDQLRQNEKAISFVKKFFDNKKPVAAICHAPQLLIEAGLVKGRKLTSYASIKTDLRNAGAHWVDKEVVVDDGLTSSRNPNDLDIFNKTMIEEFSKEKPREQSK